MEADKLYRLLKTLFTYIDVYSAVSISCASKSCNDMCRTVVLSSNEAPRLLMQAVSTSSLNTGTVSTHKAGSTASQDNERSTKALRWLLLLDPGCAVAQSQQLVHIPCVPLELALVLIAAGARITHGVLALAARRQTQAVEVWVQAQQKLGVTTDIHPIAEMLCCDCVDQQAAGVRLDRVRELTAAAATDLSQQQLLSDLLHIAVNCQQVTWTAQALVLEAPTDDHLQHDLKTVAALLDTAALRCHTILTMLLVSKVVQRDVAVGDLMLLLHVCVKHKQLYQQVPGLLQQPAAANLSTGDVAGLLETLVQHTEGFYGTGCFRNALHRLCRMPQALQIDAEGVCQLLSTAIRCLKPGVSCLLDAWGYLCSLPGAGSIDADGLRGLIFLFVTAVDDDVYSATQWLSILPAAVEMGPEGIAKLVHEAFSDSRSLQVVFRSVAVSWTDRETVNVADVRLL